MGTEKRRGLKRWWGGGSCAGRKVRLCKGRGRMWGEREMLDCHERGQYAGVADTMRELFLRIFPHLGAAAWRTLLQDLVLWIYPILDFPDASSSLSLLLPHN